jgi:gas vesicle protein GvpN
MAKKTAKKSKSAAAGSPGLARAGHTAGLAAEPLVGRSAELRQIAACIRSNRSLLLEGPVGVGKTHLAAAATAKLGRPVFRIDGDARYTEQKLTGWFDPPMVMKKGFTREAFVEGPLVSAMRAGGILFINELNRLPEGVQNVLLPALDEKSIALPRLGEIRAKPEFLVIATQNPKEFVATSHLSEAILDRFELVVMDYQSATEEYEIVHSRLARDMDIESGADGIAKAAVRLIRATRRHPKIRRGASVRAALALAELTAVFMQDGTKFRHAFLDAAKMALPTRIEIERDAASERSMQAEIEAILGVLGDEALADLDQPLEDEKKKDLTPSRPGLENPFSQYRPNRSKDEERPLFLPPEALGDALGLADEDAILDFGNASSWDVATRYHEFKTKPAVMRDRKLADHLRQISTRSVLERAQAVLGSVVRPTDLRSGPLSELPPDAIAPEIDLEDTLENAPWIGNRASIPRNEDLWMEYRTVRDQSVVLSVDTSLSMNGEKLALTAVALAVVLLQFPDDPVGIIAFENEPRILKRPEERITVEELVARFLDVPAQGYTHLESGMKSALKLLQDIRAGRSRKPPSCVLLTDGKYTAGKDPAYLAPRFPHLVVLKMGDERSSLPLCAELARKGRGALREVAALEELPQAMYGVGKDLLRGGASQSQD